MFVSIPMYRRVQEALDKLLGRTRENLSGVRVQRAFNKQETGEGKNLRKKNQALNKFQMVVGRVSTYKPDYLSDYQCRSNCVNLDWCAESRCRLFVSGTGSCVS